MDAPDTIHKLVERFNRNIDDYRSGRYKEAQLRSEFINPFFIALGWDVNNEQGWAEAYKEVIHEYSQKIGDSPKAPDYCFRIGGQNKFFVEAKKPVIDIKSDINPAFQLRRYAWSAKLPLSILTDFEEFAVYDCRVKPTKDDKASKARITYFKYADYIEKWDDICSVFSPVEIRKGSFDRYADTTKKKRGTAEVDDAFLEDIEAWRDVLAKHIILRNSTLTVHQLNRAVQVTIDRIIFLRICEDRGIEPYGRLRDILGDGGVYPKLVDLFRNADDRYNSGLFHFQKERDRIDPDNLTPKLKVDDKILRDILGRLYYPDSPYEFSVLPADILGQVYERFLGKVIRLTKGGRAKVEEKPEVRKAGGVYYTPTYIVDYIVEHTVGKLLDGKTPKKVEKLRILDPACGSGSFLIGAYQYLLDRHIDYYSKHKPQELARKRKPPIYKTVAGDWKLTTAERKRILLNNIYGVDIDTQAVEVTKLSLLLKVLEDESKASLDNQLHLLHERALPDLSDNIKCGNSLIGTDYYDNTQMSLLDDEESRRINVFDWETEFPDIFKGKNPGFDAVIGNPPYGCFFGEDEIQYLKGKYQVFNAIQDGYVSFIEQAHNLLAKQGRFSFIIPSAWLGGPMYRPLREYLLGKTISSIIVLPFDVFPDAYIDTLVLCTAKKEPIENHSVCTYEYPKREKIVKIDQSTLSTSLVRQTEWQSFQDCKFILNANMVTLIKRINSNTPVMLGEKIDIKRGVLFDIDLLTEKKTGENSHLYFEGDVYRYKLNYKASTWVEYGSKMKEYPREFRWFEGKRIVLRRLVSRKQRLMASFMDKTVITNKNLYVILCTGEEAQEYTLGILNSRLFSQLYLSEVSQARKDDFPQITIRDLKNLPFRAIDFSDPSDKARHGKMVKLVERMLKLHKQLHAKRKTQHEKTVIQRQIAATDKAIDKLVYELYGLTDDDIRIVESSI